MIIIKTGNIFEEDVNAFVNPVNCVGVMGRGLAFQFKKAFPENFESYKVACEYYQVKPGNVFAFETGMSTNPKFIMNFPTKRHWQNKSLMKDIDSGLVSLAYEIQRRGIRSIAIPPLGCGLGGLSWFDVCPRIESAMNSINNLHTVILKPRAEPASLAKNRREANESETS